MLHTDESYLTLVFEVLRAGVLKPNRTGVDTLSIFGRHMRFDLTNNQLPLLTTKKMFTRSIIHELLWFISGSSNTKYLTDNNVHIWDNWADSEGEVGPSYGVQWRNYDGVDQLSNVIDTLRTNPNDRRMIVSSWNVSQLKYMALPPCPYTFQFYTTPLDDGETGLSCMVTQRSCDLGLGVPFDIAQYSILTHLIASLLGYKPIELVWSGADIHIYTPHVDSLVDQVLLTPKQGPTISVREGVTSIDDFVYDDITINDYVSHPPIKLEIAV